MRAACMRALRACVPGEGVRGERGRGWERRETHREGVVVGERLDDLA